MNASLQCELVWIGAEIEFLSGDYRAAAVLAEAAWVRANTGGFWRLAAESLELLSRLLAYMGDHGRAHEVTLRALAAAKNAGLLSLAERAERTLGYVRAALVGEPAPTPDAEARRDRVEDQLHTLLLARLAATQAQNATELEELNPLIEVLARDRGMRFIETSVQSPMDPTT
jgi:hypothetical protein